jgi:hypothetical protein
MISTHIPACSSKRILSSPNHHTPRPGAAGQTLPGFRFQVVTIPTAVCNINHSPSGDLNSIRCVPQQYGCGSGQKHVDCELNEMIAVAQKAKKSGARCDKARTIDGDLISSAALSDDGITPKDEELARSTAGQAASMDPARSTTP